MKTKSVLVIGMGRFGRHVAMKLHELGHEVMAVDENEERINKVLSFTTGSLIGDSTDEDFIRSIGVGNFDLAVVAIGDNFQNSLETTSLLKENGAKLVVSRAARDVQAKFLLRNGADEVVYPEKQLANWTAICFSSDRVVDYFALNDEYAIYEIAMPESWAGKSVGQLDIRRRYALNILGLKKDGRLDPNITAETELSPEYTLLVLGRPRDIEKCFHI